MNTEQKRALKDRVYRKYKGKCAYCGDPLKKEEATLDHILPKALGGTNHFHNVALSCAACNNKKGCKTPQLWRMELACEG